MHKISKNLILIISMFIGIFSFTQSYAANYIGYVVAARGKVIIKNSYDGKSRKPRRRSKIFQGDIIITHKNSHVQLVFTDSGIVRVGPNSKYIINKYNNNEGHKLFSTELKQGSIEGTTGNIVKGKKEREREKNYLIKTRMSQLAIFGSSFSTTINNEEQDVSVLTGSGEVTIGNRSLKLGPAYLQNHVLISSGILKTDFLTKRSLMFIQASNFAIGGGGGAHGGGGIIPSDATN